MTKFWKLAKPMEQDEVVKNGRFGGWIEIQGAFSIYFTRNSLWKTEVWNGRYLMSREQNEKWQSLPPSGHVPHSENERWKAEGYGHGLAHSDVS